MNVVFLSHSVKHYGANRSLLDLIVGLQKYDITPFLLAPGECVLTEALSARGIQVYTIPLGRWFKQTGDSNTSDSPGINKRIRECSQRDTESLFERWGIDVVYSNSVMIDIGARSARSAGLPHIWQLREFGNLDYERMPIDGWSHVQHALAQSDATISVSQAVRRHFLGSSRTEQGRVIYDGIASRAEYDHRRTAVRKIRKSTTHRPYTFILVGRIMDSKGQKIALDALARLSKDSARIRLQIVGGGDTHSLVAYACSSGIADLVEFHGYVDDPIQLMLNADAGLMCSRTEAFGRVTAEAMSASLPVIGNNSGATSEIIEHGENGLLYEGDSISLAQCMESLASSPRFGRQLGEAGWFTARQRYSIERCAEQVWDVLEDVSRPKGGEEKLLTDRDPFQLLEA